MALRDKTVFILGTPTLPASPVKIYLDVEGDPEEGYIYLIGMLVCDGESEQSYSFWAGGKDQEIANLQQFLEALSRYEEFHVFCYGSYDKAFLKKMRSKIAGKKRLDRVLERLTNVLSVVYDHLYFPCCTNGLKDVAACLGYSWSDEAASGIQSIVWRKKWDATHDEAWKQRLLTYNLEDCHALRRVTEFVGTLVARSIPSGPSPNAQVSADQPAVMSVEDIDHRTYSPRWDRSVSFTRSLNSLIAVPISTIKGSGCSFARTSEYGRACDGRGRASSTIAFCGYRPVSWSRTRRARCARARI